MQLALVGLGKMGGNMARRMARAGVELVLFDRDAKLAESIAKEVGGIAATSLADVVAKLSGPRHVWLMLPAGGITQEAIEELSGLLSAGDTIIDGANSFYKDSQKRAAALENMSLGFVDAGVSGGVWGEKNGYALMFGGEQSVVDRLAPVFQALAPSPTTGWLHCGPAGSGHYVKMVHNGIEYGMMQAYGEGLSLLKHKEEFGIDLPAVTEMWRHGSVVRSWLLDLINDFMKEGSSLENVAPFVADSGEGRWTAIEGVELGVPTPVISLALMARFGSQGKDDYASKLLAKMRHGFGGHAVKS